MFKCNEIDQPELQILMARQGIYDKKGSVYAYELLYRSNNEQECHVNNRNELEGVQATSTVISQLFVNLITDSVLSGKPAFINFTYSDIVHQVPKLLPNDSLVIEVLETIKVDDLLISSLVDLKKAGYKIALDDFVFDDSYIPLMDIADIIKLDVLHQSKQQILDQLQSLQSFKGQILAEKIDNKEQFKMCVDLGFDYFQGFFLNKPDGLKGNSITENKTQLLKILAELNNEDLSLKSLEYLILQIPKLSYRILRIASTVTFYAGKKNISLIDAIYRLGISKIRNWTNIILLSSQTDASSDLLERTLIRAKMCELLAQKGLTVNPHDAYTVGILSSLDGMLNEPLLLLLQQIKLGETFNQALLFYEGELGKLIKYAIDYEQANFSQLDNLPFNRNELTGFYHQGIVHANAIIKTISE